MADDLTIGEVQRNVLRHENDLKEIRAEIVALAKESVTVTQFTDAFSSFRRELSSDRELSEKLASERHKAMIDRLDRMDEATGQRIQALETRELSRPMNAWMKFGIASACIVGVMSIVINLVTTFVH